MGRKTSRKPPAYRNREINGSEFAYLTLRDAVTRKPRDFCLGHYGTSRCGYRVE